MKETNPLIWGAVVAAIAAVMVVVSDLTGTLRPDNPLLANPLIAAAGGFFWGWAAGSFKNWYGRRR